MNKIVVLITIVVLLAIGGVYWYFNTGNSISNEQGYIPTANTGEDMGNTADPAAVPRGSSQTSTTKPATQGSGASNSGSNLTPPAFPN